MLDGKGVASSSWKSHEPRPAKPSMSVRTSAAHLGFEFLDLAGDELRVEQPPVLGVLRRVDLERDLGLLAEVQVHVVGGEVLRVTHRPEDVLVGVEVDLATRIAIAACDGALLAQAAVDGMRIVSGRLREQHAGRIGRVGHARTVTLAQSTPCGPLTYREVTEAASPGGSHGAEESAQLRRLRRTRPRAPDRHARLRARGVPRSHLAHRDRRRRHRVAALGREPQPGQRRLGLRHRRHERRRLPSAR